MPECLICKSDYSVFMDFGDMPIANDFRSPSDPVSEYKFPMKVGFCNNCKMVQLVEQPDRELMFHENYAFFSSTSKVMQQHFSNFADYVSKRLSLTKDSHVVEIGCNDGIMLKRFGELDIPNLGIEPSTNVAKVARSRGINVVSEFFDEELASTIYEQHGKADAIVSANVICHIPYLHSVFAGVKKLLAEDGMFMFEDPYIGDILEKTSFDQIYDEHVFFFSGHSVKNLAELHGLELIDLQPQNVHGGSMRYIIAHKGAHKVEAGMINVLENERALGLDQTEAYQGFGRRVDKIKQDLFGLLTKIKSEGGKVVAYGATSKSTTVANYIGISPDLVEAVYDTTPIKQGKLTPGMRLPVKPYEEFRKSDPDYVLLFAWNHAEEIHKKESDFMDGERKWISYIPTVRVY